MPSIHETVYPRFKNNVTQKELNEIYTPMPDEIEFSDTVTRGEVPKLCFLIMLKSFQRLGYFSSLSNIPQVIIQHISQVTNTSISSEVLESYHKSGTRLRHTKAIREYLTVK